MHLASRASFIAFLSSEEIKTEEALHKSASVFEVAVALVIPVYCGQTAFTSASINFYEKPVVETEPTGYEENVVAKRPSTGDRANTFDRHTASIKHSTAGTDTVVSFFAYSHWSRKIFHFIYKVIHAALI